MDEPIAPAEPVAVELKAVEGAFASGPPARFLDLSGRFTFADRQKIADGVERLHQKTGAKVWVLALPGKTDVNGFGPIHANLKLQRKDVLFVFSADKRHLHSQALPREVGSEILKETNKEFYKSQSNGVLQMFDVIDRRMSSSAPASTATATTTATTPSPAKRSAMPAEWIVGLVAIAVVVYVLLRPKKPTAAKTSSATKSEGAERS